MSDILIPVNNRIYCKAESRLPSQYFSELFSFEVDYVGGNFMLNTTRFDELQQSNELVEAIESKYKEVNLIKVTSVGAVILLIALISYFTTDISIVPIGLVFICSVCIFNFYTNRNVIQYSRLSCAYDVLIGIMNVINLHNHTQMVRKPRY